METHHRPFQIPPSQLSRGVSAPPIVLEAVGRAAPAMAPEPARMGKEEREPCRLLVHLVLPFFSVPHLRVQIIHEAGRTNGQLGIDKATEKWNTS